MEDYPRAGFGIIEQDSSLTASDLGDRCELVETSMRDAFIVNLYQDFDRLQPGEFVRHFADDATFAYANGPVLRGPRQIADMIATFLSQLRSISHEVEDVVTNGSKYASQVRATLIRHDGTMLSLPACSVIESQPRGIVDYRIYIDSSEL